MTAIPDYAHLADCDTCGRRTSLNIPDFQRCGAVKRDIEGALHRCGGRMRRRDVLRGDETEWPVRGVRE